MENKASSLLDLNKNLKRSREELKPLRDELIRDMQSSGRKSIAAGDNMEVALIEKKARKPVGAKAMYAVIADKLGAEAAATVKAACEAARGDAVVKYSLKLREVE